MRTPILVLHICAGMLAMLSGAVAASFRKGSHRHVVAGKVFVFSMLTMAAGGIYLAILKHEPDNVGGGLITFYLTVTAWLTARRMDGQTSKLDWTAVLIPLTMGSLLWVGGLEKIGSHAPPEDGDPAGLNFFMGSVLLLAAAGDVRMLVRRGVLGTKRISRHLWRMCFARFIATASFFLGGDNRPLRLLSAVGLRQTGIPYPVTRRRAFFPGYPSTVATDLLVYSSSLRECIQDKSTGGNQCIIVFRTLKL